MSGDIKIKILSDRICVKVHSSHKTKYREKWNNKKCIFISIITFIHQCIRTSLTRMTAKFHLASVFAVGDTTSSVARPGPTRACALPSTFQALPSAANHDSRDSIKIGNTVATRLDISLL